MSKSERSWCLRNRGWLLLVSVMLVAAWWVLGYYDFSSGYARSLLFVLCAYLAGFSTGLMEHD